MSKTKSRKLISGVPNKKGERGGPTKNQKLISGGGGLLFGTGEYGLQPYLSQHSCYLTQTHCGIVSFAIPLSYFMNSSLDFFGLF